MRSKTCLRVAAGTIKARIAPQGRTVGEEIARRSDVVALAVAEGGRRIDKAFVKSQKTLVAAEVGRPPEVGLC